MGYSICCEGEVKYTQRCSAANIQFIAWVFLHHSAYLLMPFMSKSLFIHQISNKGSRLYTDGIWTQKTMKSISFLTCQHSSDQQCLSLCLCPNQTMVPQMFINFHGLERGFLHWWQVSLAVIPIFIRPGGAKLRLQWAREGHLGYALQLSEAAKSSLIRRGWQSRIEWGCWVYVGWNNKLTCWYKPKILSLISFLRTKTEAC